MKKIDGFHKIKELFNQKPNWVLLFLLGFVPGMIIMFAMGEDSVLCQNLFSKQTIVRICNIDINYPQYLFTIFQQRFSLIGICLCLFFSIFGIFFMILITCTAGFFTGLMLTSCVLKYGLSGSLLYAVSMFPHFCIYLPAVLFFLDACYKLNLKINQRGSYAHVKEVSLKKNRFIMKIFLWILVVIIGVFVECYVNPFILKFFVKFLI